MPASLNLKDIRSTRHLLGDRIRTTPVHQWQGPALSSYVGPETAVFLKLELFQHTGTFKPRGALSNMLNLPKEALGKGVTAISAGNHAVATAFAAQMLGTSAKVVMLKTANPFRVELCRRYGAEVEFAADGHTGFERVAEIEQTEERSMIHPFEGLRTALGTATVGLELCEQMSDLDAVIVPIGGGGLCGGISAAVKLMQPNCEVFGVEPEGADTMHRSFAAGEPQSIDKIRTIADSLGAPYAAPFTFELCRANVDELVKIDDDSMRDAMRLQFHEMKLAVEPAGAAATAALCGPLRERLAGKRVALIVSGTNIDLQTFMSCVSA